MPKVIFWLLHTPTLPSIYIPAYSYKHSSDHNQNETCPFLQNETADICHSSLWVMRQQFGGSAAGHSVLSKTFADTYEIGALSYRLNPKLSLSQQRRCCSQNHRIFEIGSDVLEIVQSKPLHKARVIRSRLLGAKCSWIFNISMDFMLLLTILLPPLFSQFCNPLPVSLSALHFISLAYEDNIEQSAKSHMVSPHPLNSSFLPRRLLVWSGKTPLSLTYADCSQSPSWT